MSGTSHQDRIERDLGPDEIEVEVEFRSDSDPTMASPGAAPPPPRVWQWVVVGLAGALIAGGLVRALTRDPPAQATPAAETREPDAGSAAATPARLPVDGDRVK
jgi:hypothetical protein